MSDSVARPACSAAAVFSGTTAEDLVKAMELCQFTTENAALPQKKWGVISAQLVVVDGTRALPLADNLQVGVLTAHGANVRPQTNSIMAALSAGTARSPSDPGQVHPQNGTAPGQTTGSFNGMTQVAIQNSYLGPHGGKPPSPAQCAASCTVGCDQAFDSVNFRVHIRVPTNARSFSYQFKFYSAEFPSSSASSTTTSS